VPHAAPDSSTLRTFVSVNYNISTLEYTPSKDWMTGMYQIGKGMAGTGHGLILDTFLE
jgi:hypothetical protein